MKTTATIVLLSACTALAAPKFERQVIDDAIQIGYGLAIGDVDGDGKHDVLLADKSQIAWYRNGDWKRFVMAENLNPRVGVRFLDNVCIAARDLDGDGKVEVAVGGNWNPGETGDGQKSGSVHILERPDDPTARWGSKKLEHLPTVHRMHWIRVGEGYELVVLPLHGVGNRGGEGEPVQLLRYAGPDWKMRTNTTGMHAAHNFEVLTPGGKRELLLVGGKEGVARLDLDPEGRENLPFRMPGLNGAGEVRGATLGQQAMTAAIEPMHGNEVAVYSGGGEEPKRELLDDSLSQGHALAIADVSGDEGLEVIAGWRSPDKDGKVGIRIYERGDDGWVAHPLDDNGMACEDLKVADLNGDGKLDVIAAGRATKNVVIYWNKN